MLGASGVGKTSLVEQFVRGRFSQRYLTTVGVRISRKTLSDVRGGLELILWDLNGEDRFQRLSPAYLRGMAGYLVVIDGTRPETIATAAELQTRTAADHPQIPFITLVNKKDLRPGWSLDENDIAQLSTRSPHVIETSAKTGEGVEKAFEELAVLALDSGGTDE